MVARWSRQHGAGYHAVLALAMLAWLVAPMPASGAAALPDVDIAMVVEIRDTVGWLALYEEVLGTPSDSAKPLAVSVTASTGGTRWITVLQPKFNTQLYLGQGMASLKVVLSGKLSGADALRGLAPFEQAVLEMQAGAVANSVVLSYGLSGATAELLELHLARP
jgi:hypothetical protein